jgi:hypothetical protein
MDQTPITAQEFSMRLTQLCLSGPSIELPRRQRDRQIILKSIALYLSKDRTYSEREINAALMHWVGEIGHSLQVDHAALRRTLVDEKYLERSDAGANYRVAEAGGAGWFDADVDEIRPAQVIDHAILQAAAKRERYRSRPTS